MDARWVQMTSSPLVRATAVDTDIAACSSDMKTCWWIKLASSPTRGRSTKSASLGIKGLHMIPIRAIPASLAIVGGTTEDAD